MENPLFRKRTKTGALLSGLGVIIMLAATLIIIFLYVKLNNANASLDLANKQIKFLNHRLVLKVKSQATTIRHLISIADFQNKVLCIGQKLNYLDESGKDTMYRFTLKINDSVLISKLKKVDYFFNDNGFNPKHKISTDTLHQFKYSFYGSGTVDTLQVLLYYKKFAVIDTGLFLMSDNVRSYVIPKRRKN